MSRNGWAKGLVARLRALGFIRKEDAHAIEQEREANPQETTVDIVRRLDVCTEEQVQEAVELEKEQGSSELLVDGLRQARKRLSSVSNVSVELSDVAMAITERSNGNGSH
jgi:hypothetical protein